MGLFSFLKGSEGASGRSSDEALVERVRSSARRRLIGAVVLLGIGVVAFPLIFETQPRPIPVDIPIEIPRKDGQAPLALPAPRPAPAAAASKPVAVITESKAEAPREPATAAAASAVVVSPPAKVEPKSAPKPQAKAEPRPEPRPEPKVEPKAESSAPATARPTDDGAGRFVVQVGAFAEASAVREARARVEKIGLTTYTQAVETATGPRTRVRVGPFATREEADKVAAKLKAAGLPGAVLSL